MATILVADDNSNIQKMVALALRDQGIEVLAVGNGEAAVRKLADVRPDLVLADIFMPVRNGYEVCEFVKQDSRFAHIPVVLLVGAFDPLDEREAQRVGADGVLKKPFVPPDPLISVVKSALAKSASGRPAPAPVTVAAPVAAAVAPPSAQPEAPSEPEPATEVSHDYFTPPQRVAFRDDEKPLAFGELLQTPAVEAEPEPEAASLPERGLGEMRFWQSPAATEEPAAEPQAPAWTPSEREVPEEEPVFEPHLEEVAREPHESAVKALRPPEPPPAARWMESAPASPAETPAPEVAAPEQLTPPVKDEPLTAVTDGEASGWEEPAELAEPAWSSPVAPSALAAESATPSAGAVQSFEVPQPPNPRLVDAVVDKVIERMQSQIVDIVTREILKPVVEALVRRELEKR